MTRSKITKKIIEDTPDEVREQVRAYGDAIVMIKEAAEELKEKFEKEIGTPNDYFNHRGGLMNEVFDFFWSEIESRNKQIKQLSDIITERTHLLVRANEQISELELANKMYKQDLEEAEKQIKELEKK